MSIFLLKYSQQALHTYKNSQAVVFLDALQSGASSRAKNGGAYFSAVTGSIQDPIAVPGPCEVTEFSELRNVRDMGNGRYM